MTDRYNVFSQMEHLHSKYPGCGHPDTTRWEWMTNQHRDTYASIDDGLENLKRTRLVEFEYAYFRRDS